MAAAERSIVGDALAITMPPIPATCLDRPPPERTAVVAVIVVVVPVSITVQRRVDKENAAMVMMMVMVVVVEERDVIGVSWPSPPIRPAPYAGTHSHVNMADTAATLHCICGL
jgi:hypothetical protein